MSGACVLCRELIHAERPPLAHPEADRAHQYLALTDAAAQHFAARHPEVFATFRELATNFFSIVCGKLLTLSQEPAEVSAMEQRAAATCLLVLTGRAVLTPSIGAPPIAPTP